MSLNQGIQFKQRIEAMTNNRKNEISNELNNLNTDINNINAYNIISNNFASRIINRTTGDNYLYNNNVRDICNNIFNINNKGVIKKYIQNNFDNGFTNSIIDTTNNLTDLDFYEEIQIPDGQNKYHYIKGTDIALNQNIGDEDTYTFSNRLIDSSYDIGGSNSITGQCFKKTDTSSLVYDISYNFISPLGCKQMAVDNYKQYYIMQDNTCYLTNNVTYNNLSQALDISCNDTESHKIGISINNTFGIYDNVQTGNLDKYRKGGYIDFDSNFVEISNINGITLNNRNTILDNMTKINNRTFIASDLSLSNCDVLRENQDINGFVIDDSSQCYFIANDLLLNPANRIYSTNHDILMKQTEIVEGIQPMYPIPKDSYILSNYREVTIPTFSLKDILERKNLNVDRQLLIDVSDVSERIYGELERYNRIIRRANLKLSNDISLNMKYINESLDQSKGFKFEINISDIKELKRKLQDTKMVLGHNHDKYILWTIAGVATLFCLLKLSNYNYKSKLSNK